MAGLLSRRTRRSAEGIPGLKQLPVLGTLFRSDDFIRSETELVVIVTPYLVGSAARTVLKEAGSEARMRRAPDAGRGTAKAKVEASNFGFIVE